MTKEKFVLCRPEGGLNDLLCQIGASLRYAKTAVRKVIIDTNFKNGRRLFADDFGNHFSSRSNDLVFANAELISSLNDCDVVPKELQGRVNEYNIMWGVEQSNWLDARTGVKLTFKFDESYSQDVLVHHQCGGGLDSIFALSHLSLTETVVEELVRRITMIGTKYTAVHIRNTDYATSITRHLDLLRSEVVVPLFVATDNADSLSACIDEFGRENVVSFARLPETVGAPIHSTHTGIAAYDKNVDAITDVLCLAFAHKFIKIPLDSGAHGVTYSGFSNLAEGLRADPGVLRGLVGDAAYYRCREVCSS